MRLLPIGIRLTAWYFCILAVGLSAFALVAFVEMRKSILAGVDDELRDRVQGFQGVLANDVPFESQKDIALELAEHTGGNDVFRMADPAGNWVYRSPAISPFESHLSAMGHTSDPPNVVTVDADGVRLRILTATMSVGGQSYRAQVAEPMAGYEVAVARFTQVLLVCVPLLLIIASGGGYWLSHRALRPVDEIIKKARDITAQNLSTRLEVAETHDELQRLSETLNAMFERLELSFQRITHFTADASHELKTPLALMRTMAELRLRRPRSEQDYRTALKDIVCELGKTSTLVEDLLTLARADYGRNALHRARIDLAEVARAAGKQGEVMAKSKGVSFHEEIENRSIWIDGDRESLERLCVILLDNAVKYTSPNGRVTLKVSTLNGSALINVLDTGVGIDKSDAPYIFDRFYRADRARTRDLGGTGLGLAIGRWIAEAHGGSIDVTSTVGQGSSFRVQIPLFVGT